MERLPLFHSETQMRPLLSGYTLFAPWCGVSGSTMRLIDGQCYQFVPGTVCCNSRGIAFINFGLGHR